MNSVGGEDSDQNDSEMTERLTKYNPEGKRKAGRIYVMNNSIRKASDKNWWREAKHRDGWSRILEDTKAT